MTKNNLKWQVLFLLCFSIGVVHAQEAISTAGANASGSGGTSSYTVGQVAYSYASNQGSVTQGVQQSYVISTVLGVEMKTISLNVSVYPNPTVDKLTLTMSDVDFSTNNALLMQLYDMDGRLLKQKEVASENTIIDMAELRSATYYVRVINNEAPLKTFKIIKN